MSFDPSEPRDPHTGQWIKIAKALKSFQFQTAGNQDTVQKALGELPKGGHGNLIKLNKVEIRRHQKGGVNLKINGESRYYENHQHAALAVIQRKHNEHGIAKPGKAGAAAPAPATSLPTSKAPASKIKFDYGSEKPSQVAVSDLNPGDVIVWGGKTHIVQSHTPTAGKSHQLTLKDMATGTVTSHIAEGNVIRTVAAAKPTPTSWTPDVHGSPSWEYEKGLITAEEHKQMTGAYPPGVAAEMAKEAASGKTPGSVVTATQLKNGDTIWHNGEKWTVQGEPYHTTSGNSYFKLKPVESNLPSKSLSVDSNATYKIASPETDTPEAKYAAGNMTAGEYYAQTGKYPSDALKAKAQSVAGSPAAKAVAKAKPKSTGPYTEVTANAIMKGDVIKGINPDIPLKHYRVEKATKGSSSTTLQLIDVNGQTMTKVLAHGDKVQKSNTPEKFSVGSIPGVGSSGYTAAVQEYDAKADLPSGIKMGAQAWDSVAQVEPPDNASWSAIHSYCGSGYGTVNPSLRKGLLDSHTATTVSAMDRAFISVAPLSSQIVVHRGFSNDQSILGSVGSHVGGVFIDNGFISTSTNEGTSKSFGGSDSGVLCDIIVPVGVRVVKPGEISGHGSEKEIILNRGTKFKIVSDKMVTMAQWGKGVQKRRVVLEVIP
jgi:translation elongation factor P/translation initiation factor 5A